MLYCMSFHLSNGFENIDFSCIVYCFILIVFVYSGVIFLTQVIDNKSILELAAEYFRKLNLSAYM